jgi:hypothetical protein
MGKKFVSDRTKQCRALKNVFGVFHFLCLFGPLLYFIPYGYATGETVEKIGMSFTVIASVILAVISILVSVTARAGLHRCIMWILITGVLFTLKEIQVFIWIMAITSILDELIFTKVRDHYRAALISNKEIDRRV